ncbi:MAG TPA: hypothetical protein VK028_00345, partial [Micromonosporaceae bacterium]|nr:hypothetical protein [Micromonosporaceae bacterium]
MRWSRLTGAILTVLMVAAGCTDKPAQPDPSAGPAAPLASVTTMPEAPAAVAAGRTAIELAVSTSRLLFASAPAAVLVGADDQASMADATATAQRLGVPLLATPSTTVSPPPEAPAEPEASASPEVRPAAQQPAAQQPAPQQPAPQQPAAQQDSNGSEELLAEIERLAARTLVTVGDAAHAWATGAGLPADGPAVLTHAGVESALPAVQPPTAIDDLLVLAQDEPASQAAIATARAAGARVLLVSNPDPRTSNETIEALASQPTDRVLGIGDAFGTAEILRQRVDTAATGVLLPGGGQVLFPGRRMVALYGHPGDTGLGALGEQSLDAAVKRAKKVAASYQSLVDEPVIPAFEIITTVASASAGPDGDYSSESSIEHIKPWVDAAKKEGIYVVLDLQPGRTDFLTQAKRYAELLKEPHVGLALDPEWRLAPGQRHMVQIGSVSAKEVNATAEWL